MIQTILLFQHLVTSLEPINPKTLQQEYPGKFSYVTDQVLEEYVILVKCFLHFGKPGNR